VGCELIRQAALGLQYSFEQGMVHRDIKPSNLTVTKNGTVKILDFGLAKMHSELATDPGLTSTGAFLGSVDYMAPEQADDPRRADIRADIYSLGCTLYHLLSGGPPFQGKTYEVLEAHRVKAAPLLSRRRVDVPAALAALVARMMAKNPASRLQTPGEVARELESLLTAVRDAAISPGSAPVPVDRPVSFTVIDNDARDDVLEVSNAVAPGRKSWLRPWLALLAALGTAAMLLLGWIAYRSFTARGEVVIESDVPDVAVRVTQGRKLIELISPGTKNRRRLKPGEYEVGLFPDEPGLRITRETISLKGWDKVALAVRRVQVKPDGSIAEYLSQIAWLQIPADASEAPQKGLPASWFASGLRHYYPSADGRYNQAVLLARHGWLELAIETFRAALEAQPDDPDTLSNLGVALSMQGEEKLDEAIANFREAIRLEPDAADVHAALGLALADQGKLDEAISEVRKGVALKPDLADGWYNLGVLLKDQGQASAALDAFHEAIRLEPDVPDAYDKLGDIRTDLGRTADAVDAHREARRLQGVAVAQNNLGIELAEEQKLDEAIAAFRTAIRIQPRLAAALVNLGTALLRQEKMEAAVNASSDALRLEPGLAEAHLNLGIALKRYGEQKAAFAGAPIQGFHVDVALQRQRVQGAAQAAYMEAARLQPRLDLARPSWVRAAVEIGIAPPRRAARLRGPRVRP
jgi:tetratricopeptide (TPR) repeat protein